MRKSTLRWALDPAAWAQDNLNFHPDPWQVRVLRSPAKRKVFNCARQSGKSTVAAIKALHRALFYPGSLIILISPSLRQSSELFRKVTNLLDSLPERPELTEDNRLSLTTATGSRIISLPSNERTIRGYSAVDLVIEDEAAAVPDEIYTAVRPMLAISNGEYCQLSTPRGRRGHFWEAWSSDEWEKVMITAAENPRISAEFLAAERAALGSRMFAQEYECVFLEEQEGNIVNRNWWQYHRPVHPDDVQMDDIIQSWDCSFKETGNSYVVGQVWGAKGPDKYLLDQFRERTDFPGTLRAIRQMTDKWPQARTKLIEDAANGPAVIATLKREISGIIPVRAAGSKEARLHAVVPEIEAGNVYLPEGAPWVRDFIEEFVSFPNGANDDQVDAATQALTRLTEGRRRIRSISKTALGL